MNVSYEDFKLWKTEPVTEAYFSACIERIEEAKDILSVEAGINPDKDNYFRGFIQAYREMLDFRVED